MGSKKFNINKRYFKNLPETPGVYTFWTVNNVPIYIGKAKNLKRRLMSYLLSGLGEKTKNMVSAASYITYIKVGSELEALLLEAKVVRKNKPKYNVSLKDDKKPLYIKVTKDIYPQVLTARKSQVENLENAKSVYGPFPSSGNVYYVLKMLRRIFPFAQHPIGKRPCMYSHIGLCDPCPNKIEKLENETLKIEKRSLYIKNIRYFNNILSGKFNQVKIKLEKEMNYLAKLERFEEALLVRKKIELLDYITQPITPIDHYLKNPNFLEDVRSLESNRLKNILLKYIDIKNIIRIECFDVAHISGSSPTASMVTFINGEPDKTYYRHFRIRSKKTRSDTDSLNEVARRRSKHLVDWGSPDLIIVDGGKGQVTSFTDVFDKTNIPVVGIAKRLETLIIPMKLTNNNFVEIRLQKSPELNLIQRLRDEAHRFARSYHHKLITRTLINANKI